MIQAAEIEPEVRISKPRDRDRSLAEEKSLVHGRSSDHWLPRPLFHYITTTAFSVYLYFDRAPYEDSAHIWERGCCSIPPCFYLGSQGPRALARGLLPQFADSASGCMEPSLTRSYKLCNALAWI